nr:MAG: hypothetical protein EDM05_10370 [Leptolyngbya sp. IPPAS B-1204]
MLERPMQKAVVWETCRRMMIAERFRSSGAGYQSLLIQFWNRHIRVGEDDRQKTSFGDNDPFSNRPGLKVGRNKHCLG